MTISDFTLTPALFMDIILIMISGLAVLYCALLSTRLKRLSSLKSGLGASIITLTEAIEKTHSAAIEAQTSTQAAVAKLEDLLTQAEQKTPKIDALISELENASAQAEAERRSIMSDVEKSLAPALEKATMTASGLLEVIQHIQRYKKKLAQQSSSNKVVPINSANKAKQKTVGQGAVKTATQTVAQTASKGAS